mgnify:FL=1
MQPSRSRTLAAIAWWLAAASATATAAPVPSYSTLLTAAVDGSGFVMSTGFGQLPLDGAIGIATAESGTVPAPYVSVAATSVSPSTTALARGSAQLFYSFQVVGPASNAPIPVLMTARGDIALAGGHGLAYTHFTVGSFGDLLFERRQCAGFQATGPDGKPCDTPVDFYAWQADQAQLFVDVAQNYLVGLDVLALAGDFSNAIATIDPVFEIDPRFAGADQYQIVFSAGIVQAGPDDDDNEVPEAPTLALLAPAAWALAMSRRRRQLPR